MLLRRLPNLLLTNALLIATLLLSSLGSISAAASQLSEQPFISPTPTPSLMDELTVRPAPGTDLQNYPAGAPFKLIFSEPMDPASANPALLTYPYVPGELAWSENNTVLTFQPGDGFKPNRSYQVFLDRDLKSAARKLFVKIQQWQIDVPPGPQLLSRVPFGPELLDLRPQVQLNFDREMDHHSVLSALSIEPSVPYTAEWKQRSLVLNLRQPLAAGQSYRFTLAKTARDSKNTPLDQAETWQYWVADLRAAAAQRKADPQAIELKFNYELNAGLSGLPFQIDPPVAGKWTWENSLAVFKASLPVPTGQVYTISARQPLATRAGDPISMPPVTFTPAPPVSEYGPVEGSGILENSQFYIGFAFAMDHPSTEAAFQVSPAVKGHFAWDKNLLKYIWDEPLAANRQYTITLSSAARDAQGQPAFIQPFSWSFETVSQSGDAGAQTPPASFGCAGGNVQVIDAGGPRAIQFDHTTGSSPLAFSLYHLDLPRFVELYKTYYQDRGYYYSNPMKNPIPTAGLERVASWTAPSPNKVNETHLPASVSTGVYILNLEEKGLLYDQLFVAVTHNGLVAKHTGSRLWIWASELGSAKNAADLEVRLYTKDGALMREGKTGEDGIFETSLPKDNPPMLVAVRGEGDDIAIAGFEGDWQSNWWGYGSELSARAYIYTDRPIYRPGQAINFKAILRNDDDVRYTVPPAGTPLKLRVLDPRDNEIQTFDLQTNDFGTANSSVTVAQGAGLGEYTIQAVSGTDTLGSVKFKVEDYHKPDFQVLLNSAKDRYAAGDSVNIDIDARYFFGEPLPNAPLTIRIFNLQSWYWWGEAEDIPEVTSYTWYPIGTPWNVVADEKGHYQYSFTPTVPSLMDYQIPCQTSWMSSLRRCTMGVEVTATDPGGQPVSATRILTIYNSDEKYSLDTGSWVRKPKEKFTVQARAATVDGSRPVANRDLTLEVLGWDNYDYSKITKTYELTTSADGLATQEISLDTTGGYSFRLTPAGGNPDDVSARDWVYIYSGSDPWMSSSWGSFSITASQTRYKPYQKASLAIQSDFSGPALLTFERGRVIHEQLVMLTAPLTTIETEMIPEYAPNVYVAVNAWKPQSTKLDGPENGATKANYRLMTEKVELQVDAAQNQLNIAITPDKEKYVPRQEATFNIQVTDAQNQPVEAELSLALVDEAIFSLSGDLARPIFQGFYGRREQTVTTSDSFAMDRWLGFCGGGHGGGGGGVGSANPRSDFPDTAAWYPQLRTDKNGKASLTLTLPDSLTTWRVLVKAVTLKTQVGDGQAKILTRQDVVAQPVLPRTLTAGDQVELGALVHNYTGQARDLAVSLKAEGLDLLDPAVQDITLKAGEVRLVRWQVKAGKAGDTAVNITAATKDGADAASQDAVRLPLTVRPRVMPDVDTQVGDFQGELTATLVAPETMLDLSTVDVRLSRSEAGSLLDGVEYLTGYPYGCVEQTMSKALPNAVVGRAFTRLGVENPHKDHLAELIGQGVQRLYGFQHDDGGWGWWHDDDSTVYQTAWVVYGLSVTRDAGYPVDAKVIERGATYLKQRLVSSPDSTKEPQTDLRTRAFALFSLAAAGQGDKQASLKQASLALLESAGSLDSFSQAALALALHQLEEDAAAHLLLDGLARSAVQADNQVYWESSPQDGQYYEKTMASSTRTTALALEAFVQLAPDHPLVSGIVRYLMGQRRADGWGTTNETAYTILALTDHLQSLQAAGEAVDYQVLLNNQPITSGRLAWKSPLITFKIHAGQLKTGINQLKITTAGEGRLYYTITSRMLLDRPSVEASGSVKVLREYLDPKTNQPVKMVRPGDLVRVRLTVKFPTQGGSYILVEDNLPGGLEAVNERLNTSAHYGGSDYYDETDYPRFYWQEYGYNQKEVFADRVSFFVTSVNGSEYRVDYLARAGRAGSFIAPPATVYAMYDLTLWGRSASGQVEVAEP